MRINGRRVLIVDDDILVGESLNELLSLLGYNVEYVNNGEEAISLINAGDYDILITDYMMPGVNGIELVKKVRDMGLILPIIGISGTCNEKDFLAAGANIFMNKPLTLKGLWNALEFISNS